jgi:pyruvate formate lyase activating enzyme
MKVNLGGIVHLSTVDWPGRACMVVFLRGCPLRCPHCQNRDLWEGDNPVDMAFVRNEMKKAIIFSGKTDQITLAESILRTKVKPFISALVLSGGDPLMQPEQATAILGTAKSLGLHTGLEISGYYPERLSELLKKNVVDRVFLDIKAALKEPEYSKATRRKDAAKRVLESLEVCMGAEVPLEIRTTVFPEMPSFGEIAEIAKTLHALKETFSGHRLDSVIIQQGIPREREFEPVSWDELHAMAKYIDDLEGIKVQVRAAPARKANLNKVDKADSSEALWHGNGSTAV